MRTRQSHLRLRKIGDLEVVLVQTPEGCDKPELTTKYKQWFNSQERDRPLPFITLSSWGLLQTQQDQQVPLYESLLLDAELELESDPRVGVLYSALACEIFIQSWLEAHAEQDDRLKRWLDWAERRTSPEGSVSARSYYDLGLYLVIRRSLKDNKDLWKAFERLVTARNDVAHRGRIQGNYDPAESLQTARNVISWVLDLVPEPRHYRN